MTLTVDSAAWTGRRTPQRRWHWPSIAGFMPPRPILIPRDEVPMLYAVTDALCAREGLAGVALFDVHNPMMPAAAACEPQRWRILIFPRFFRLAAHEAFATLAHELGHLANRHGNGAGTAPMIFGRLALLGGLVALWWLPWVALPLLAGGAINEAVMRHRVREAEREADLWAMRHVPAALLRQLHGEGFSFPWRWRVFRAWQAYPSRRPWLHEVPSAPHPQSEAA
jgi:Zn-dependent protease with chaperone function